MDKPTTGEVAWGARGKILELKQEIVDLKAELYSLQALNRQLLHLLAEQKEAA